MFEEFGVDTSLIDWGRVRHSTFVNTLITSLPFPFIGSTRNALSNRLPGLLAQETAAAARVGAVPIQATVDSLAAVANQGTLKWVVTEGGGLIVSPHTVRGVEISHAVLSGGRPVLAAGHAEIAAGGGQFVGLRINASSGHFGQGAVEIGEEAFRALGVTF